MPVRVCRLPAPLSVSRSEAMNHPEGSPERERLLRQAEAKEEAANRAYFEALRPDEREALLSTIAANDPTTQP